MKVLIGGLSVVGSVMGAANFEELPGTSQSWVWGSSPHFEFEILDADQPLSWRFPHHGFIELTSVFDRIEISLVKRPPVEFWPAGEKFCTSMLPAAIAEFIIANEMLPEAVKMVSVTVDAHPYKAACKCYMRLLLAMGLNRVGEGAGVVVTEPQVEEFCEYEQVRIEGRPPVGSVARIPEVSEEAVKRLREAPFISRADF